MAVVQPNQVNFRIMAERKVKPEIMHLMILDNCDHKCNLCCNKMYDIDKIPVATVEEMKTVHTVCITGGEPFMSNINIDRFALNLKKQFPNGISNLPERGWKRFRSAIPGWERWYMAERPVKNFN